MTLEQLVSIDYNEEEMSFRNENLKKFYAEKFEHLANEINDLSIELSFRNDFNSKLSLWGKKNSEHGLSLIRYVFKTVCSTKLISLGFKNQHFEFLINTFSKNNFLQKVKFRLIFLCN